MTLFVRVVFGVLLFLACQNVLAQNNVECIATALYKETNGQSLESSRAVYDVLVNRVRIDKMHPCQVVKKKGSFPWAKKQKTWKISNEQLTTYFEVFKMQRQVGINVYSFNNKPFVKLKDKFCCKIDGHYFYFK